MLNVSSVSVHDQIVASGGRLDTFRTAPAAFARQMHDFREHHKAIRAAWYQQHGNPNAMPTANTLRQQRPAAPAKAFGPFAAFDAAVEGRTVFVHGYTRANGTVVQSYYRQPATRRASVEAPVALAG
jgi:hypothetical protein